MQAVYLLWPLGWAKEAGDPRAREVSDVSLHATGLGAGLVQSDRKKPEARRTRNVAFGGLDHVGGEEKKNKPLWPVGLPSFFLAHALREVR